MTDTDTERLDDAELPYSTSIPFLNLLTLMHDCIRLSGMFFMLTIGGGSAEMKHLVYGSIRTSHAEKGEK